MRIKLCCVKVAQQHQIYR